MRIITALILVVFASSAMACGTVKWAIDGIYEKGPMAFADTNDLFKSLASLGGPCRQLFDRQPQKNQQRLMSLLLDESLSDFSSQYGDAILTAFQCLSGRAASVGFSQLKHQYSDSVCFDANLNKDFFVSALNGGNLRIAASVKGKKLTTLKNGTQVKELARTGQWVKVQVMYKNPKLIHKCKFASPCRQGYVHANLLRR